MNLNLPGLGPVEVPEVVGSALCGGDYTTAGAWLHANFGGLGFTAEQAEAFMVSAAPLVCPNTPPPPVPSSSPAGIPTWAIVVGVAGLAWWIWR